MAPRTGFLGPHAAHLNYNTAHQVNLCTDGGQQLDCNRLQLFGQLWGPGCFGSEQRPACIARASSCDELCACSSTSLWREVVLLYSSQ
jgi:hypothetical protein